MNPLNKGQLREEDRYKRGCGRSQHPRLYSSLLLARGFFSELNNILFCCLPKRR